MRYRVIDDPFKAKQPALKFLQELNEPVHRFVPKSPLAAALLEINFPDSEGLLDTAFDDFRSFLTAAGIASGPGYRFCCQFRPGDVFEAYTIEFETGRCVISAGDTEGIRRGLVFVEDEMQRRGGLLPTEGRVTRRPWLLSRIAHCVFSPLNEHLPDSEELADDVDYYSDNYLNRLAHDGVNGIWISTAFRFMLPSKIVPEYGINWEKSIAKLNRTIAKCARYGIGVYLLANEPASTYMNEALKNHPDLMGRYRGEPTGLVCPSRPLGIAYAEEAGRTLFTLAPGLKGLIVISAGESLSSCASRPVLACDFCQANGYTLGQALAACEAALWRGIASVKPSAELISWTYDHRSWQPDDVRESCRFRDSHVIHMQNFEDYGLNEQLGKTRLALDYWLSYVGPGEVFKASAQVNQAVGNPMYAKLQVACSHETASVPYIPVPGILFDKFKTMRASGVTGAQYSWYFGSYPSIMTKAAGELAFLDSFDDKTAFLRQLAAIHWPEDAERVADAWALFSESYQHVPSCVAFEWYGPLNDAPAWKLFLQPVDLPLAKAWKAEDHNGDRFGECLLHTFTPDEACQLLDKLCQTWQQGLALFPNEAATPAQRAQQNTARALDLMFESARDALVFYTLRNELGLGRGDAYVLLSRLEAIVRREIELSGELAEICAQEPSIGYHAEALAYKFFPEKLRWRADQLTIALTTDFAAVRQHLAAGLAPLEFFTGQAPDSHRYVIRTCRIEQADWEPFSYENGEIDEQTAVRFACDGQDTIVQLRAPRQARIRLQGEYTFFVPSAPITFEIGGDESTTDSERFVSTCESALWYGLDGSAAEREAGKYRLSHAGGHLTIRLAKADFGLRASEPFRVMLRREGDRPSYWVRPDRVFSRLIFGRFSPDAYGFVISDVPISSVDGS